MATNALDKFLKNSRSNSTRYEQRGRKKHNELDEDEEDEKDNVESTNDNQQPNHESDVSDGEDIDDDDDSHTTSHKSRNKHVRDGELVAMKRLHAQGLTLDDTSNITNTITGKKRSHSDSIFGKNDDDVLEKFSMDDELARPEHSTRDRWLESLSPTNASHNHHIVTHVPDVPDNKPISTNSSSSSYDSMEVRSLCDKLASCLYDEETVQAAMKRIAPKNRNRNKKPRRRGISSDDVVPEPQIDDETRQKNKEQLSTMTDLTSALIHRGFPQIFSLDKSQLVRLGLS